MGNARKLRASCRTGAGPDLHAHGARYGIPLGDNTDGTRASMRSCELTERNTLNMRFVYRSTLWSTIRLRDLRARVLSGNDAVALMVAESAA